MSEELIEAVREDADDRMGNAVGHVRQEFSGIRSGRANSGLVEKLSVDYYGTSVPLQQLASFSIPEARLLVISPFDKASVESIEKSIRDANLGLNPSNDGAVIRLAFPQLTEERRRDFVRMAKQKAEDGRTAIRGTRRDARKDLESLEKDGDLSEDQLRRAEDKLDEITKNFEAAIDEALDHKTVELMEG
jgi:ribosome recycling factor